MPQQPHIPVPEELAAFGLLQMANRTAEIIDDCQSLIQQLDEVMAKVTIVVDPENN